LQVAMIRASFPPEFHLPHRGFVHGDPEPCVEGRRGDAMSQVSNDRGVVVHPQSPGAA